MCLERNLTSIGKSKFVEYFYEFKDLTREEVIEIFTNENYGLGGTIRRYNAFQNISGNNQFKEALELIICDSPRLLRKNPEVIEKAKQIYKELGYGKILVRNW